MIDKVAVLRRFPLFSALGERELELLARYCEHWRYHDGMQIFRQGSWGEELYVVCSGEVSIHRRGPEGEEQELARYLAGDGFGELELLDGEPRAASAVAVGEADLLIFPRKGRLFSELAQKHPEIFARILHRFLAAIAGRIRSTNRLISEKTPWIEELRSQMLSDRLTGLYNRLFLEEEFAELLPEYGEPTSLVMIKPDNFKEINDTYGHDIGDGVLKLMAEAFRESLRRQDVPVRYRGDEFAAVLPRTNTMDARRLAESLRERMSRLNLSHLTRGSGFTLKVSIGISTYPTNASDNRTLTSKAFQMMFEARNRGGDRVLYA